MLNASVSNSFSAVTSMIIPGFNFRFEFGSTTRALSTLASASRTWDMAAIFPSSTSSGYGSVLILTGIPVEMLVTLVAYTFTRAHTSRRSEMVKSDSPSAVIWDPAEMDLAVTIPVLGDLIWNTPFSVLALNRWRLDWIFSRSAIRTSSLLCASTRLIWEAIPSSNMDWMDRRFLSATSI